MILSGRAFPVHMPEVRGHMPALDGLRGLAVLAVMAFHFSFFSNIPGDATATALWHSIAGIGWVGVDLFFVLSGFLITGILYDSRESLGYFRVFYARRILRIFPLYYGVLALLFIVLPLLAPGSQAVRDYTNDQVWYWTHLANVQIALRGDWGAISPYVAHFWSLAVEEQFYMVWPVVVLLLSGRQLLRFCAAIIAFSLLFRIYLLAEGASIAAFVLTPARMDTLAFGAVLAIALRDASLYSLLCRVARPIAGAAAVVLCSIALFRGGLDKHDAVTSTIGYTALAAFFSMAIFFALAAAGTSSYHSLLSSRRLRFFGKYSYALYVFHQPVALLLTAVGLPAAAVRFGATSFTAQILYVAIATLLTVGLSMLSWDLYEKQFLKLKDRVAQRPARSNVPIAAAMAREVA